MIVLDYLFYRIYSFYKKKRDSTPVLMGCLVLMVLTFSTLLTLSSIIEILFKTPELKVEKYFIAIILLGMLYLIYRRYNKNQVIEELVSRYKDEKIGKKRLRGWFFIFYLILVFLIPISIGYMRHNLGMDI
jgi:hypothetical protein